jgi:23S rRNA (adenine2030-N6)-methyltransferase
MVIELLIRAPVDSDRLNGCGLVVLNPPFTLEANLAVLLPVLADRLSDGAGATGRIVRL